VVVHRVTPASGVFVYGPAPVYHDHYVHQGGEVQVQKAHLPDRSVDRADSLAVGVKAGTLVSGTEAGDMYSDLGVGLLGRYRPAEAVGLQLDLAHHAGRSEFDLNSSQRSQTQVAGSVELFAFPWTRVSPYLVGGATWNARSLEEQIGSESATTIIETTDALWGLHGGLGVELAMGDNFALDLEGRYVGWLDRHEGDPPGALQANAALLFHFK
jgi:opacity protein-like surface antigen